MKKVINEVTIKLLGRSFNESYARGLTASFIMQLDPTIEELNDIKTAVSEAVTNSIVHGYKDTIGDIVIAIKIYEGNYVHITIKDKGCGIPNISQAMEPLYTTGDDDRSGMGFTIMESFMDKITVSSKVGKGTTVTLQKKIRPKYDLVRNNGK